MAVCRAEAMWLFVQASQHETDLTGALTVGKPRQCSLSVQPQGADTSSTAAGNNPTSTGVAEGHSVWTQAALLLATAPPARPLRTVT